MHDAEGRRPQDPGPDRELPSLDEGAVTRLLGLGLTDASESVQALAARIASIDGAAWIEGALRVPGAPEPRWREWRRVPLDRLIRLKDEAKARYVAAGEPSERHGALWTYLVAVAAARVGAQSRISSRSDEELAQTLLALAEVLHGSWCAGIAEAGLAFEESDRAKSG